MDDIDYTQPAPVIIGLLLLFLIMALLWILYLNIKFRKGEELNHLRTRYLRENVILYTKFITDGDEDGKNLRLAMSNREFIIRQIDDLQKQISLLNLNESKN